MTHEQSSSQPPAPREPTRNGAPELVNPNAVADKLREFANALSPSTKRARVWGVLNSPFVMWIVTTVVVGSLFRIYEDRRDAERKSEAEEERQYREFRDHIRRQREGLMRIRYGLTRLMDWSKSVSSDAEFEEALFRTKQRLQSVEELWKTTVEREFYRLRAYAELYDLRGVPDSIQKRIREERRNLESLRDQLWPEVHGSETPDVSEEISLMNENIGLHAQKGRADRIKQEKSRYREKYRQVRQLLELLHGSGSLVAATDNPQ